VAGSVSGNKWFVVVDGKEGKQYDGIVGSPIFSPDGKRVAYAAVIGDKQFVVVDGKEGKQYDGIVGSPIFSPDSKRVAYAAVIGDKQFVVLDGKEEKQYDVIITIRGGRIVFDSDERFHYLAVKDNKLYLVEKEL
jgi:roadblock/LC7 domain-containing protein